MRYSLRFKFAQALRKGGYKFAEESNARVIEMRDTIHGLENHGIQFNIEQYPDGTWSAESVNIDGIMTGGLSPKEIPDMIKDAIFTYFEIPPKFCNDTLLRNDNEPVLVEQRVHVGA